MNRRILSLLSVLVWLSVSGLRAQMTVYLPQIASGTIIQTTFVFFNNGNVPATVVLSLTDDDGNPWTIPIGGLGTSSMHFFTLQSGETRFFKTDPQGDNLAGAARVTSTAEIGVSAIFSILRTPPTLGVLTEAGVGASEALTEFVVAVDTAGEFNTGIAIQDVSGAENEVTFTLYGSGTASADVDSQTVAGQTTRTLPPNGHLAVFVDGSGQLFPGLGQFRGRMVVSASSTAAAVTLRQSSQVAPLTTLPVVPTNSSQTSFSLPQVANGGGIKTQFVIFGLGSAGASAAEAGTVNLDLTNDAGNPFSVNLTNGQSGSSFALAIDSEGALFLETDGSGSPTAGAARVTSDIPIGVSAVFTLALPGQPLIEAGVGDSPSLMEFSLPADQTAPFNTGVALFNNNSGTANVTVKFINQDATVVQGQNLNLRPFSTVRVVPSAQLDPLGGFAHRARYVPDLFPGANLSGRQGQVAVESNLAVAALTLRQGPTTLTTLPVDDGVADVDEPAPPEGTETLPVALQGINLTDDLTLDQALPGGYRISGTITSPAPTIFPSTVVAVRESDSMIFTGATDSIRNYAINVPAGSYDLRVCALNLVFPLSSFQFVGKLESGILVSENVTRNITIPAITTRQATGTVTNLESLSGLGSVTSYVVFDDQNSLYAAVTQIDENGDYQVNLVAGNYRVSLAFISGPDSNMDGIPDDVEQSVVFFNIGQVPVAGANLSGVDFAVPASATASGIVTQPQTPVIPENSAVIGADLSIPPASFLEQCFPVPAIGLGTVDPDGTYEMTLQRNRNYDISATIPVVGVGTQQEGFWSTPVPGSSPVLVNGNLTRNFAFPNLPAIVTLNGTVTDPNGIPLSGVSVQLDAVSSITGAPNTGYVIVTSTQANGSYSAQVLSGSDYTVRFDPGPPQVGGPLATGKNK